MASVDLHSARTTHADPGAAADDLLTQVGAATPKLAVLFASSDRDQTALNKAVRERLPKDTRLVGATTSGEIDKQGIHSGSVVLASLTGDFEVGLGLGRDLSVDAIAAGNNAIASACSELGVRPEDVDEMKYVGMVMDDGSRFKKEELLIGMLERNAGIVLVGGGAANADQSAPGTVHVDGEVATNAAFVALFRTDAPWAALRAHWYKPTGKHMRITKVDGTHRHALEIDGKPAAERYSEILGVPVDELDFGKPRGFANAPLALKVGREYFIRAPAWAKPDGSIEFANLLEDNTSLELMELDDMVGATRRFFEELPRTVPSPKAAVLFHCGGRMWFAHARGVASELSDAFKVAPPCVGLNVNFEIYCGFHINSTLTALVFGEEE